MNERGVFSYVFIFAIIIVILGFLFVIAIPIVQNMMSKSFEVSEDLLADTNTNINALGAGTIKTQTMATINAQQDASATNFEILGFLQQYGWFFILLVFGLYYLLAARRNVEYQGM